MCYRWIDRGIYVISKTNSKNRLIFKFFFEKKNSLWNGQSFNFETITQAHETAVRSLIWVCFYFEIFIVCLI